MGAFGALRGVQDGFTYFGELPGMTGMNSSSLIFKSSRIGKGKLPDVDLSDLSNSASSSEMIYFSVRYDEKEKSYNLRKENLQVPIFYQLKEELVNFILNRQFQTKL